MSRRQEKSTSGGVLTLGAHLIKSYSRQQKLIALSSAEAEFYAMIEAVTCAKGLLSLACELGFKGFFECSTVEY